MLFLRNRRRRKLRQLPIPDSWPAVLERYVPAWELLPATERLTLTGHMQVFLAEKNFEGCGGLALDEAMQVAIAGNACLLLLGNPGDYFPGLGSIVVYPESFAAPISETDELGIVTETVEERLGESWQEGTVVLAWENLEEIARREHDDLNVVIHEFAHQLDAGTGLTSGSRLLVTREDCRDWEDLLVTEQRSWRSTRRRGSAPALDPYALHSPEELFAVASELFFERPLRLKTAHPALYLELQAVYRIDPAGWIAGNQE